MAGISAKTKDELVKAIRGRYRCASKSDKRRILDEFVALTAFHRKHAIRVLAVPDAEPVETSRTRPRLYDDAVREALIVLWEASDRVCGKRLKPLLPVLLPALERHGHVSLDARVREQLYKVSAATIDRMLAGARRATAERQARVNAKPKIRNQIAVRTFADWRNASVGTWCERARGSAADR